MNASTLQTESLWVLGHKVRPIPTEGNYGLVEIVSYPQVPGPPPHHHEGVSEFFYIIEGQLDVNVDGEWVRLGSGETLSLKPGQVHTLMNRIEAPCRWLTGWNPGGFEAFFTEFGVGADQQNAMEVSISKEVIERVLAEGERFGMVVSAD